jgi:hypothetical protein
MPIIPYADSVDPFVYLDSETAFGAADREWLTGLIKRFGMAERDAYTKALFVSYLLYICGDRRRMEVVLERLAACLAGSLVPIDAAAFLETWFDGAPPEDAVPEGFSKNFAEGIRPRLTRLAAHLAGRATTLQADLLAGFEAFAAAARERLFLDEREIHMEELFDPELEGEALRWEYKYLGREQEKILARRSRYLAAGSGEPLKTDVEKKDA